MGAKARNPAWGGVAAMVLSDEAALGRVRAKGFLGACVVGGAAGGVAAWAAQSGGVLLAASGVLLVLVGGNVGGFVGMFLRGALRWARGGDAGDLDYSTEAVLVLSAYGGFLGLVGSLLAGEAAQAHLYATAGAALGGVSAAGLGHSAFVLLRLLVLDQMDEPSRVASMSRAVRDARSSVLSPEDPGGPSGPSDQDKTT